MRRAFLVAGALVGMVLTACSSKGAALNVTPTARSSTPSASSSPSFSPSPRPTNNLPPYHPTIDPSKFTDKVTNPYFPLPVGSVYIYEGTRDGVPRRDEVTATSETKVILGVPCVVVRDVVTSNNALVEKTTDWYAQDDKGNVWYFGEDTAEYTNGAVSSTAGTWLAGLDGALPGIVMEASPKVGDAYRQEYRPGVAEDFATVQQVNGSATWPTGTYNNIVVTQDTDLLDASKLEHKSYAAAVGYLGSEGMVNGHHEIVKLTQILKG